MAQQQLRGLRFNLVIERLLISGPNRALGTHHNMSRFNLVIERLLISGEHPWYPEVRALQFQSRYRAASHFRFH